MKVLIDGISDPQPSLVIVKCVVRYGSAQSCRAAAVYYLQTELTKGNQQINEYKQINKYIIIPNNSFLVFNNIKITQISCKVFIFMEYEMKVRHVTKFQDQTLIVRGQSTLNIGCDRVCLCSRFFDTLRRDATNIPFARKRLTGSDHADFCLLNKPKPHLISA